MQEYGEIQLLIKTNRSNEMQQAIDRLLQATDPELYNKTAIAHFFGFTKFQLKTSMQWFEKISDANLWNLLQEQRCILLGGISESQYDELLNFNVHDELTADQQFALERLGVLWGISELLTALVGQSCDIECFSKPNSHPIFCSKSIKEYLLTNRDIESFRLVEKYLLDAIYY